MTGDAIGGTYKTKADGGARLTSGSRGTDVGSDAATGNSGLTTGTPDAGTELAKRENAL